MYLIWSNEHKRWWGPDFNGYEPRIENAGRYTREQALMVCTDAMPGRQGYEPLPEIPVLEEDLQFMLRRFKGMFPTFDPEPTIG